MTFKVIKLCLFKEIAKDMRLQVLITYGRWRQLFSMYSGPWVLEEPSDLGSVINLAIDLDHSISMHAYTKSCLPYGMLLRVNHNFA